jgi:hypothetical protein
VELSRAHPDVDVALAHARQAVVAADDWSVAGRLEGGPVDECHVGAAVQVARCHWAGGDVAAASDELQRAAQLEAGASTLPLFGST